MKRILLVSMLATLCACGSSENPDDRIGNMIDAEKARREANRTTMAANGTGMEAPPLPSEGSPASAPASTDRARLVGRWGATPACQGPTTEFLADGTLRTTSESGRWTLDGARLTLTAGGNEVRATMVFVNPLEIMVQGNSGRMLTYHRCTSQTG